MLDMLISEAYIVEWDWKHSPDWHLWHHLRVFIYADLSHRHVFHLEEQAVYEEDLCSSILSWAAVPSISSGNFLY